MNVELIISIIALALASFAAVRSFGWTLVSDKKTKNNRIFFESEKAKNVPEAESSVQKEKKNGTNEDVFKKTLQSIEDYRKHH